MVMVCAGTLPLAGCGAGPTADKDAENAIEKADQQRAGAQSLDDLAPVQTAYDNLANNHNLSKQMQVVARSRQEQLRMERISMMIDDLRSQELVIGREITDIEQLAMQVAAAQSSADALKVYDPTAPVQALTEQAAHIQGSATELTWSMANPTTADPNGKVTLPTLFAVKQEIDTLQSKIQQNKTDTEAAHKLSASKGDEAEVYLRKSEGENGDQQVTDTTASATDRKDAAIADATSATLTNNLARMQASLDRAKQQEKTLTSALQLLNDQIQSQQTRWTGVSDQITAQKKLQEQLVNDSKPGATSIGSLAADLSSRLQDAATLREKINDELNVVIDHLNGTIQLCNQLRNVWMSDIRQNMDDPDAAVWKEAEETLHPGYFSLQLAGALEDRATVAAAKARIDLQIYHLRKGNEVSVAEAASHFKHLDVTATSGKIEIRGIDQLLDTKKTGIDMPKAFDGIQAPDPDQLSQEKDEVNKAFQEAVDAYDPTKFGATDTGPVAAQRRDVALMGGAEANRKWAQFSELLGDKSEAQNHRQSAADLEAQMDSAFALSDSTSPAAGAETGSAARAPSVGRP
jgi:hypothetical protein